MKMSKQSYNTIRNWIQMVSEDMPVPAHRAFIITEGKAKDIEKRLRWDFFNYAVKVNGVLDSFVCNKLYKQENLNDDHIDSALKSIFKELKLDV